MDYLFDTLTPQERKELDNGSKRNKLDAGIVFAKENELPECFFLILSGAVQVSKRSTKGDHLLDTLHPGELAGESALIDDLPRPVTLTTKEPATILAFEISCIKKNLELYNRLILLFSRHFASRLRKLKNLTIEAIEHRLAETQKRVALGTFLVGAIYITDIYTLSLVFISYLVKNSSISTWITASIILLIVLVILILIKKFKYPLEMFGISNKNWKKDLLEAIWLSMIFIGLLTFLKWIIINNFYSQLHLPLFDLEATFLTHAEYHFPTYIWNLTLYALFVPLQEFIVRGTLQGTFLPLLGRLKAVKEMDRHFCF